MNAAGVEVGHGYTMADLDRAARFAVGAARTRGADADWRYQIAWSAVAEMVWVVEEPPRFRELVRAGANAIDAEMRREPHHHGYRREDAGGGVIPAAAVYWWEFAGVVASPERGVVERTAFDQILAALPAAAVKTLLTLAIHGTYQAAAEVLGVSDEAFRVRLGRARSQFLALWYEGETRRGLPPHGASRYKNHGCRCPVCSSAYGESERARLAASVGKPVSTMPASRFELLLADRAAGATTRQLTAKYRVSARTLTDLLRGDRVPAPEEVSA